MNTSSMNNGRLFLVAIMLGCASNTDATIIINEFLPNPIGSDSGNEWMELYNGGSSMVDPIVA